MVVAHVGERWDGRGAGEVLASACKGMRYAATLTLTLPVPVRSPRRQDHRVLTGHLHPGRRRGAHRDGVADGVAEQKFCAALAPLPPKRSAALACARINPALVSGPQPGLARGGIAVGEAEPPHAWETDTPKWSTRQRHAPGPRAPTIGGCGRPDPGLAPRSAIRAKVYPLAAPRFPVRGTRTSITFAC